MKSVPIIPTVPIVLESTVNNLEANSLVRLNYFRVEIEEMLPLNFSVLSSEFRLLILSLEGVVTSPSRSNTYFESDVDIDRFIRQLESTGAYSGNAGLVFGVGSLLLPLSLLESAKRNGFSNGRVERGDVFRIREKDFIQAWKFSEGKIGKKELFDYFAGASSRILLGSSIRYSQIETKSFSAWSEKILQGM